MDPFPAITLSRTFASAGGDLGLAVARALGWRFCDRHILREAAKALAVPVAALRCQDERPCGFLDQLLKLMAFASPEIPYTPPLDLPVYSEELFEAERSVMLRLAQEQPVVLVGRGGFVALKDRPRTLHLRVVADVAWRAQRLLARGRVPDLASAEALIVQADRDRAAFIRQISGWDVHDSRHFDLVLDPSNMGFEACVAAALALVEAQLGTNPGA